MTAALLTDTYVGGPIGAGSAYPGTGLVWGIYSFTKVSQNDWVVLGEFTAIKFVIVTIAGDQAENADIDGTTTNKVTLASATTGACLCLAIGTPISA